MGPWAAVGIATFIFIFAKTFHFDRRLKVACYLSAFFYFSGYLMEDLLPLIPGHFYFFQSLDLLWGVVLLVLPRGPVLAVIACWLNWLILGYLPLQMDYEVWNVLFPYLYVALQSLLVGSITIAPYMWPNTLTWPLSSLLPFGSRNF